jgi:lysine-N-methylase
MQSDYEIDEVRLPRYLDRFRCVGAACEFDCCTGWAVDLDREAYLRIQRAMEGSAAERAEFHEGVKRQPPAKVTAAKFALTVLRDRGPCFFLDDKRLCTLQARYGEPVLSRTCANYPRQVRAVGARMEVTATASCPEIARQLLLHGDANDVVSTGLDRVPRPLVDGSIPANDPDPYRAALDVVRDSMLVLLLERRAPLSVRLAALGCAAEETRAWFHRGVRVAPAELGALGARVGAVFDGYATPAILSRLALELPEVGNRDDLTAGIVMSFLSAGLAQERFGLTELFADIARAYAERDAATAPADVYRAYLARRDRWTERFAGRIDGYFTNWAVNYAVSAWYLTEQDLVDYTTKLFVRVATLRFLLFSHPLLDQAEALDDAEARAALLDRAAVDAVQRYTRGIEHSIALVGKLDTMVRAQASSSAHAVFLVKM